LHARRGPLHPRRASLEQFQQKYIAVLLGKAQSDFPRELRETKKIEHLRGSEKNGNALSHQHLKKTETEKQENASGNRKRGR
jgi:hypothetical protein